MIQIKMVMAGVLFVLSVAALIYCVNTHQSLLWIIAGMIGIFSGAKILISLLTTIAAAELK